MNRLIFILLFLFPSISFGQEFTTNVVTEMTPVVIGNNSQSAFGNIQNVIDNSNYNIGGLGFDVESGSFQSNYEEDYRLIDIKNYLIVKTGRLEHATVPDEWGPYLVKVTLRRMNDGDPSYTTDAVYIPLSYSSKHKATENDFSIYHLDQAYSRVVIHKVELTNDQGSVIPWSASAPGGEFVPQNIMIQAFIEEERYDRGNNDPTTLPNPTCSLAQNNTYFDIDLSGGGAISIPKPSYYEVEWVYVDNSHSPVEQGYTCTSSPHVFEYFGRSGRIITENSSIQILNVFPLSGNLFFRYRRVRPLIEENSGAFTINTLKKRYSDWVCGSRSVTGTDLFGEKGLNWNVKSTYAENNLRKDVITFYDGSNKERLSVTNLSTEPNYVITSQSLYDYEGNPVISILPSPTAVNSNHYFNFRDDLNYFHSITGHNDKDDYDKILFPEKLDQSPSNDYYGTGILNSNFTNKDFIPKSEGYAYSFTELNGFGESRPVSTNTPGEKFKRIQKGVINPPEEHISSFEYVEPLQQELDIMFGNDVGKSSFYRKTISTDPNGQGTISYTDGHGRTVATAILSYADSGRLLKVDTKPDNPLRFSENLIETKSNVYHVSSNAIILKHTFYVEKPSQSFGIDSYKADLKVVKDFCPNSNVCFYCKYDLELILIDPEGERFDLSSSTSPLFSTKTEDDTCKIFSFGNYSNKKGRYTLIKKYTVRSAKRDAAMEAELDQLISQLPCLKSEYDFIEEELSKVDFESCRTEYEPQRCESYLHELKRDLMPGQIHANAYSWDESGQQYEEFGLYNNFDTKATASQSVIISNGEDLFSTGTNSVSHVDLPYEPSQSKWRLKGKDGTNFKVIDNSELNYLSNKEYGFHSLQGLTGAISTNDFDHFNYFLEFDLSVLEIPEIPAGGSLSFKLKVGTKKWNLSTSSYVSPTPTNHTDIDLTKEMFYKYGEKPFWNSISLQLTDAINNICPYTTVSNAYRNDIILTLTYELKDASNNDVPVTSGSNTNVFAAAIDNAKITKVSSCDCSDQIDRAGLNDVYLTSFYDIMYPYQCLYKEFKEAEEKVRIWEPIEGGGSGVVEYYPHELELSDFQRYYPRYRAAWVDQLVKLHPLYCNFEVCQYANSDTVVKFENLLKEANTAQEVFDLYSHDVEGNVRTPVLDLANLTSLTISDPLLSGNMAGLRTWLKAEMDAVLTPVNGGLRPNGASFFTADNGDMYSLEEVAMLMTLATAPHDINNTTLNLKYPSEKDMAFEELNSGNGITSNSTGVVIDRLKENGLLDQYWNNLKNIYLGYRSYLKGGIYKYSDQCADCYGETDYLEDSPKSLGEYSSRNSATGPDSRMALFDKYMKTVHKADQSYTIIQNTPPIPDDTITNLAYSGSNIGFNSKTNATNITTTHGNLNPASKLSDCEAYVEKQLRDHFTIVLDNGIEKIDFGSKMVVLSTVISEISAICDGHEVSNHSSVYTDLFTKFSDPNAVDFYASSDPDITKFERSPYLIMPIHPFHDPFLYQNVITANDLAETDELDASIAGSLKDVINTFLGSKTLTNWNALLDYLSTAGTGNKNVVTVAGSTTNKELNDLTTNSDYATITSITVSPKVAAFEQGLALENTSWCGQFFTLEVAYGSSQTATYYYYGKESYYAISDDYRTPRNPKVGKGKIGPIELAGLIDDFVTQVVGLSLFNNTTTLAPTIWQEKYPLMLKNYISYKTGVRVSMPAVLGMLQSTQALDLLSIATTSNVLESRFPEAFFPNGPTTCADEYISGMQDYIYEEYDLRENSTPLSYSRTKPYMSTDGIKEYFVAKNIGPFSTIANPNVEVTYAEDDYLGEAPHLYVVEKDPDMISAIKEAFLNLLVGSDLKSEYSGEHAHLTGMVNSNGVTLNGEFIFPNYDSQNNRGRVYQAGYKHNQNRTFSYFSYNSDPVGFHDEIDVSGQTTNDSHLGPLTVMRCSDGKLWTHFKFNKFHNGKLYQENTNIWLDYEMFNKNYTLGRLDRGDSPLSSEHFEIIPIIKKGGEVQQFYLEVSIDGKIVRIPGRCDYTLAQVCMVPYVQLWSTSQNKRETATKNCEEMKYDRAVSRGKHKYRKYIKTYKDELFAKIKSGCKDVNEELWFSKESDAFHYTLYYYDQAGNLVKTVPPKGVDLLVTDVNNKRVPSSVEMGKIASFRANPDDNASDYTQPDHTMPTIYDYSSYNKVVEQSTPDGGITKFFYDDLGRVLLSQNAAQADSGEVYSYTVYDDLGRIVESGQIDFSQKDSSNLLYPTTNYDGFRVINDEILYDYIDDVTRTHVVKTFYGREVFDDLDKGTNYHVNNVEPTLTNIRNRVSAMCIYEHLAPSQNLAQYDNAIYYGYDIGGNVNMLWRNIVEPGLDAYKKIQYEYDLVSGNVNEVHYQKGEDDYLAHRYTYDADNRIVQVQMSRDDVVESEFWRTIANYEYYPHGPLSRATYGANFVQGIDYAYTLQGWLKQVNGDVDMGSDGPDVATDAFSYALHYYDGDYEPVNSTVDYNEPVTYNTNVTPLASLYNGNIGEMDVHYSYYEDDGTGVMAEKKTDYYKIFRYDQLNRLKWFTEPSITAVGTSMSPEDQRLTDINYDANGNMTQLKRRKIEEINGATTTKFTEDFTAFTYKSGTNQLESITDNGPNTTQLGYSYTYDANGNMQEDRARLLSVEWNPIGKVSRAHTAKYLLNEKTRPIDEYFYYDPLGSRIKKEKFNMQQVSRTLVLTWNYTCDDENVKLTLEYTNNIDGSVMAYTLEGLLADLNQKYSHLYDLPTSTDPIVLESFEDCFLLGVYNSYWRPNYVSAEQNTEYYVRDASSQTMAIYEKTYGLEETQDNYFKLLENAKDYRGYSDNDIIADFVLSSVGVHSDFVSSTYPLMGYGSNPTINISSAITNHDILSKKLVDVYSAHYVDEFYADVSLTMPYRSLVRNTSEFENYAMNRLMQEVAAQYPSWPPEAIEAEAISRFNTLMIDPISSVPQDYFEDIQNNIRPYMYDAIFEDTLKYHTDFKGMLITHLNSDPLHEQELYNVASKVEIFEMESIVSLNDYVYNHLMQAPSYDPNDVTGSVATWMAAVPSYSIKSLLDADERAQNDDASLVLLTIDLVPYWTPVYDFDIVYDLELAEHHLYGSDRLGILKAPAYEVSLETTEGEVTKHIAGHTLYELKDHLSNVRSVVTDRKLLETPYEYEYYEGRADVVEYNDYYPFGMKMEDRSKFFYQEKNHWLDYAPSTSTRLVKKDPSNVTDVDFSTFQTADWDEWCSKTYSNNEHSPCSSVTKHGSPYWVCDYQHGNVSTTNSSAQMYYDANLDAFVFNGPVKHQNHEGWNFHYHDLAVPYSGNGNDTLIMTFEMLFSNAEPSDIKVCNTSNTNALPCNDVSFDLNQIRATQNVWGNMEQMIIVNDHTVNFSITGDWLQSIVDFRTTSTFTVKLRNIKFYTAITDKWVPAGTTVTTDNALHRHGFNGMSRETIYESNGYEDKVYFEDDFSAPTLVNWNLVNDNNGTPVCTLNTTTDKLEFLFSHNSGSAYSNSISVLKNRSYTWEVTMEGIPGGGIADPSLAMAVEYYDASTSTWGNKQNLAWFPENTGGQEQTFSAVITPTSDQMRFVFERFNHNYPNATVEAVVSDIKLYRQEQSVGDYHGLDFGARIYDPKTARFFSIDPKAHNYPYQSPFVYALNNPVYLVDKDGESGKAYKTNEVNKKTGRPILKIVSNYYIYGEGATKSVKADLEKELHSEWNRDGNYFTYKDENGTTYDVVFEFKVEVLLLGDAFKGIANAEVENNYFQIDSDGGVSFTITGQGNKGGNTGYIAAEDLIKNQRTFSHEMNHGFGGDGHPIDPIEEGQEIDISIPQNAKFTDGTTIDAPKDRHVTQENINSILNKVDFSESGEGNVGRAMPFAADILKTEKSETGPAQISRVRGQ